MAKQLNKAKLGISILILAVILVVVFILVFRPEQILESEEKIIETVNETTVQTEEKIIENETTEEFVLNNEKVINKENQVENISIES